MTTHPRRMNSTYKIGIMSLNQDSASEIAVIGQREADLTIELRMEIVNSLRGDNEEENKP